MAAANAQLAEFEALVLGTLAEDNATRAAAEALLRNLAASQANQLMLALLTLLRESRHQNAREFAAIILRQHLIVNSSSPVWKACTADTQRAVQAGLLWLFQHEHSPSLRRKVADAVAATATRISGKSPFDFRTDETGASRTRKAGEMAQKFTADAAAAMSPGALTPWPELMPVVLTLAAVNAPQTRESLCDLIEKLAEFNPDELRPHLPACKSIIVAGMQDASLAVRLSALRGCISLLISLEDSQRVHMKDTVGPMFAILNAAYADTDEDTIIRIVTVLGDLVEAGDGEGAKFLRDHIKPVQAAMSTMASSPNLAAETRRVCLSFLLILLEAGKGMVRKTSEFAAKVIPLAFSFLTELQDTQAWSDPAEVEAGDDDDSFDNYKFGSEAMHRLADALGGKLFLQYATPLIMAALQDQQHWNVRHAALVCLARSAIGCHVHMEKQLKDIMNRFVMPFALKDPHPRVRWAAVDLCGNLAEAFEPNFPNDYTAQIFELLVSCMQPANHWRVISNACLCFNDVARSLDKEKLIPHMEGFLRTLVPLLGMSQFPAVVGAALAAVSSTAAVATESFGPFYDSFMPGVKGLIMSCSSEAQKPVRCKAVECLGMIAQAVPSEKFAPELEEVMEAMLGLLATGVKSDDPLHNHVETTMARICRSQGKAFLKYLPRIMPQLLHSSKINDAVVITNEGDANAYKGKAGWQTTAVEVKGTGKQEFSLNTSLLEEKALAIRMMFEYVQSLEGDYLPYAKDTADVMVPCIRYQFNQNVRENAAAAMPSLMRCVKLGLAHDANLQASSMAELFRFMWPQLIEAIKVEGDLEVLSTLLDALREVIAELPFPLDAAQMDELSVLLNRLINEVLVRFRDRDVAAQNEDHDEAQQEIFEMEGDAEDEFLGYVYQMVAAISKNSRDAFVAKFQEYLYGIVSVMLTADDTSLRTSGVCILSQVMEDNLTNPTVASYCELVHKICLETLAAPQQDAGLMQSCFFGLGVVAMVMKAAYAGQAENTVRMCFACASDKRLGADFTVATDNAVSTMAKIFIHVFNGGAAAAGVPQCPASILQMMGSWVDFLPCDGDLIESQKIHAQLTHFIGSNNPIIMGEGFRNLGKVLGIFSRVIGREDWEEICTPETKGEMVQIFQQLQQAMPEQQVRALFQSMTVDQRKAFAPFVINAAFLQ